MTLFIHADHQIIVGWAQVQPDDVAQLLDEERIVGQLKAFRAMRLQVGNNAVRWSWRCQFRQPRSERSNAWTIGRSGVQRRSNQLRRAFVIDRSWRARENIVVQASQAPLDETRSPLPDGSVGQLHPLRDRVVGLSIGATQYDARSTAERRGSHSATRKRLKLRTLLIRQHDLSLRSAYRDRHLHETAKTMQN
ncbi:hypothetical protein ACVIHH_008464 [Bradyrhizobium sp. USDA 4518]